LAFVLFPIALALSVLGYRRTVRPRGFIFWLGSIASAVVTVAGLGAVVVLLAWWLE
jgi:hypothetical protein